MEGNAQLLTLLYTERVHDLCHMDDGTIRSMPREELCDLMKEFDELEAYICDIETIIAKKRIKALDSAAMVLEELQKRGDK